MTTCSKLRKGDEAMCSPMHCRLSEELFPCFASPRKGEACETAPRRVTTGRFLSVFLEDV